MKKITKPLRRPEKIREIAEVKIACRLKAMGSNTAYNRKRITGQILSIPELAIVDRKAELPRWGEEGFWEKLAIDWVKEVIPGIKHLSTARKSGKDNYPLVTPLQLKGGNK